MRQAEIYRKDVLAGILTEDGGEYRFCYEHSYLEREDALPISLMPLQEEAYVSPVLQGVYWFCQCSTCKS